MEAEADVTNAKAAYVGSLSTADGETIINNRPYEDDWCWEAY